MDKIFIFFAQPTSLYHNEWPTTRPADDASASESSSLWFASSQPPSPHFEYRPTAALILIVLFALIIRVTLSLHSYSGAHHPPMFGDYEAQRHWMETTLSLPPHEWYTQTERNDLMYWGLDYPPLTAYVSYACGLAARYYEPAMVALNTSRGYETPSSKLFMRNSVLVCDLLTFIPAVIAFIGVYLEHKTLTAHRIHLFILLINPAFILIDHGHFQYNCVALGLTVMALTAMFTGHEWVGAIAFCLALSFKHMTLYYAPSIFAYLLGQQILLSRTQAQRQVNVASFIYRVFMLGVMVVLTFALMLLPWIISDDPINDVRSVFVRLFPIARGLYEDKVANFWCATSLFIKWPTLFDKETLFKMSGIVTLTSLLPSAIHCGFVPTRRVLLYSMFTISMSFFLFSFQVHEKSILLPLLPIALLWCDHPLLSSWMTLIATFSMFPLLSRDGLTIAYAATQVFNAAICAGFIASLPVRYHPNPVAAPITAQHPMAPAALNHFYPHVTVLAVASLFGAILIHLVAFFTPQRLYEDRYPDLMTFIFIVYSFVHFVGFYLFVYCLQLTTRKSITIEPKFADKTE